MVQKKWQTEVLYESKRQPDLIAAVRFSPEQISGKFTNSTCQHPISMMINNWQLQYVYELFIVFWWIFSAIFLSWSQCVVIWENITSGYISSFFFLQSSGSPDVNWIHTCWNNHNKLGEDYTSEMLFWRENISSYLSKEKGELKT